MKPINPKTPPKPARAVKSTRHHKPAGSRKTGLFVAAAVVVALALAGILPRMHQENQLTQQVAELKREAPTVSVITLKRTKSSSEITLPSNLQAIEETTINAHIGGYVQNRYVDIGSKVNQGELLAVIESPETDQIVSQAEAQVSKSQAGLGQAQADEGRFRAGILSAIADATKNQAGVLQAQADLAHVRASELRAESAVKVTRSKEQAAQKKYSGTQADLKRAKAGLEIAGKTLDRWKQLYKSAAVSGQDVDERQADFDGNQAQVESAQANVSSAQADLQAATESIQSVQADVTAAKADVTSASERVNATRSTLASSRANVQAAKEAFTASQSGTSSAGASIRSDQANARRAAAMRGYERIVAPFAGVITARNIDVGDLVNLSAGDSGASDQRNTVTRTGLFGLAKTDILRGQVNVPESYVAAIREGEQAEVEAQEYPGKEFPGTVFRISGALDASSRTLLVEVRVPNASGALKPGMYAQIRFLGSGPKQMLLIPANALIFDSKGNRVAVVRDNTIHFAPVTIGKDNGDTIEILGGLQDGESVVSNPDDSLREGDQVKPVREVK